jgi:ABC-type multidrug transport system fused ATPase/permease subunit
VQTVRENIAYGWAAKRADKDALPADDAVRAAATDAFAHGFVSAFPDG